MIEDKGMLKLIHKAMRGNTKAYGKLMEHYKEYLYRTAIVYLKDEDAALDAVQECVLKGFRSIKTLKNPEYFQTWLTRILINCTKDIYKKTISYINLDELEHIASTYIEPVEEKWDLYYALDRLSEKHRTVIILKYYNEMKNKEIAEVMQIPEGSVAAYLTRAKEELRKYLKEDYLYEA